MATKFQSQPRDENRRGGTHTHTSKEKPRTRRWHVRLLGALTLAVGLAAHFGTFAAAHF